MMNPLTIWNSECRKTRLQLALWAGNDLDERDVAAMERHLAICPHCREVGEELRQSQQLLETVRPAESTVGHELPSVWVGVSRHIRLMDERRDPRSWRDWLPTCALAAACIAAGVILFPAMQFGDSPSVTQRPLFGPARFARQVSVTDGVAEPSSIRTNRSSWADSDSYRNF
jgi:hypothetical protein